MRLPDRHRISAVSLGTLGYSDADLTTLRAVARARHSRNLLVLKAVVDCAARCGHPDAPAAERAFGRLADIERMAPAAVSTVVHHPPVTAWAFRTLRSLADGHGDQARPGRLEIVAAAAAIRAGLAADANLGSPIHRSGKEFVALPTLGRAFVSGRGSFCLRGREVVGNGERVAIPDDPHQTVGGWYGLPRLVTRHRGRETTLLLDTLDSDYSSQTVVDDDEPFSAPAVARWQRLLAEAWRLLERHHAQVAVEVIELVRVLVPLVAPGSGLASATPGDAFGAVAMTPPPNPNWFALTLAHEVQHVKLTAVTDLFPLLEADEGDRYYAPWRDDPRPAFGLLHGMYAHVGVSRFWHRELEHLSGPDALDAEIELARWRSASRDVGHTLERAARLTDAGRIFLHGMTSAIDELFTVSVSPEAEAAGRRLGHAHRVAWLATNGGDQTA